MSSSLPAYSLWNGGKFTARSDNFSVLINIRGKKQLDCSGVMIAPRIALTAGHCLHGASEATIRVPVGGGETIAAERWIVNPSWNAGLPLNGWDARINAGNGDRYVDIAVMLLAREPKNARPIPLAGDVGLGASLKTYGYARNTMLEPQQLIDSSTASFMPRLSQRGPLKIYASGGAAWCQGDSGGAITARENGQEKLVGVIGLGLGAIEHEPSSALAARWGSAERVPKCGSFAYAADLNLHSNWISSAASALTSPENALTSTITPRASKPFIARAQTRADISVDQSPVSALKSYLIERNSDRADRL